MDKNGKDTRYTIALFSFLSKNIEVPEELIDDKNPLQFKPFAHVDLLNFYATDHGRRSQNILKDFCGVWNLYTLITNIRGKLVKNCLQSIVLCLCLLCFLLIL